jgi:hypothetical protein
MKLTLSLLPEKMGICHFGKHSPVPDWVLHNNEFASITKTPDELSVICPQDKIPSDVMAEKNWRVFKVDGPLGFVLTGVVSSLSTPLAEAGISIFYVSTYETDYLMVEEKNLEKTKEILSNFCEIK